MQLQAVPADGVLSAVGQCPLHEAGVPAHVKMPLPCRLRVENAILLCSSQERQCTQSAAVVCHLIPLGCRLSDCILLLCRSTQFRWDGGASMRPDALQRPDTEDSDAAPSCEVPIQECKRVTCLYVDEVAGEGDDRACPGWAEPAPACAAFLHAERLQLMTIVADGICRLCLGISGLVWC